MHKKIILRESMCREGKQTELLLKVDDLATELAQVDTNRKGWLPEIVEFNIQSQGPHHAQLEDVKLFLGLTCGSIGRVLKDKYRKVSVD